MESGHSRKSVDFRLTGSFPSTGGLGVSTQTLGGRSSDRLAPPPWDVSPVGQRDRSLPAQFTLVRKHAQLACFPPPPLDAMTMIKCAGRMRIFTADERVADVSFSEDSLCVALRDGRKISVPLTWYPKLLRASPQQRKNWKVAGGGYGIHWPDLDEDLSTEGLLRGAPAPRTNVTA